MPELTIELPTDEQGRTYLTLQLLQENQIIRDFWRRTRASWIEEPTLQVWYLTPADEGPAILTSPIAAPSPQC